MVLICIFSLLCPLLHPHFLAWNLASSRCFISEYMMNEWANGVCETRTAPLPSFSTEIFLMLKETAGINNDLLSSWREIRVPCATVEFFFPVTIIRVRNGELGPKWLKRKNLLCSGKKGKVLSFKLEATITVIPITQTLHVMSQDVIKNTLIRREVKRWHGVPQKSLPGLLLTDSAPRTRHGLGGHLEASFCPWWCRCGCQARRSEAEDEGQKAGGLKK